PLPKMRQRISHSMYFGRFQQNLGLGLWQGFAQTPPGGGVNTPPSFDGTPPSFKGVFYTPLGGVKMLLLPPLGGCKKIKIVMYRSIKMIKKVKPIKKKKGHQP